MKIDIHAKNLNVDPELTEIINRKVGKLSTFHTHILDTAVYLKDEGITEKEVQIKLSIKNQTLVCKERGETFEKALDLSVDGIKRQLQKYKQK